MRETMDKQLVYLEFLNRERSFRHHRYSDELNELEMLRSGNLHAVDAAKRIVASGTSGHLSDDPLKNRLYLNICHITLCTRFAIEGGMDSEKAYNASDVFIRRCDAADTLDEQYDLHIEMTEYFTNQVAAVKKANVFSKSVILCMDYIQYHLHEPILVSELADMCRLSDSYLSVLFKRETGMNITEYIMIKRMETAENMLRFSDFTLSEISDILHFSSYSHFARVFRRYFDTSPKKYRDTHYRRTVMTE
jgi:AraC-like DNA-binding protein